MSDKPCRSLHKELHFVITEAWEATLHLLNFIWKPVKGKQIVKRKEIKINPNKPRPSRKKSMLYHTPPDKDFRMLKTHSRLPPCCITILKKD